jgi:magnesium chelatase subunit D
VRAVSGNLENRSIALEATLRAAAPFQLHRRNSRQAAIQVTARDLRYKQFSQNASILFIFAVDASGSMALNRMNQAKGALMRLLQQAYLHRDKVALISFRSNRAEVLLPPTRSVELAKRALDALPAGGGTPLAAGIEAARTLAGRARYAGVRQAMLVLFTDGLANVGRGDSSRNAIWHELSEICAAFRLDGFPSVVIDTRSRVLSGGEAERLAQMLDAKYIYLQRPDGRTVHEAVIAFADTVRQ